MPQVRRRAAASPSSASPRSSIRPARPGRRTGRRSRSSGTAAGKQDLFVATPGQPPARAHRLPGRSRSAGLGHRRLRVGVERRDPVRQGRSAVDRVAGSPQRRRASAALSATPAPSRCRPTGADRVSAARPDLDRLGCGEDRSGSSPTFPTALRARRPGLLARRPLARVHGVAQRPRARGPAVERRPGALDGERRPASAGSASSSAQGGDVAWIPTVGAVSGVQFAADGAVVYQELSPDGKTREIKATCHRRSAAHAVARPRRAVVVAHQPRRQAAGLARRQVGGVRQRSHRLDPRLRDAGQRHVGIAGEAADVRQLRRRPGQLVARQQAARVSPQRRRQPDGALHRRRRRRHRHDAKPW